MKRRPPNYQENNKRYMKNISRYLFLETTIPAGRNQIVTVRHFKTKIKFKPL